MKGNEAVAKAAINAGCRLYFAYPITPQSELIEYMAKMMPTVKGTFLQAESEVAAINMVYGAAGCGKRVMTSSSSPGISLKMEGISYIAGAELPCVIVNVQRGGPGLGDIQPAQGDYFQATKGGGHGDYHCIVLAPSSVQEFADMASDAFDLADKYRNPVMILADGMIGQMMEGVTFPAPRDLATLPGRPWAVGGQYKTHRPNNHVTSLNLVPEELEKQVNSRFLRYEDIKKKEVRCEEVNVDKADLILVAYGTAIRVCLGAVQQAKAQGVELGLFRPISLWPFPYARIAELAAQGKRFLTVEMSKGQMVEDVRLAANGKAEVSFFGRCGGMIPSEEEVLTEARRILGK